MAVHKLNEYVLNLVGFEPNLYTFRKTSVSICKDKMSLHVAVWPYHKCISASVGKNVTIC